MKIIRLLLAVTVAISVFSGAAPPASATVQRADADIPAVPTHLARDDAAAPLSLCLAQVSGVPGTNGRITGRPCSPSDASQKWVFLTIQDGVYHIRNVGSRNCLEASSAAEQAPVIPVACNTVSTRQHWTHDIGGVGGNQFRQIKLAGVEPQLVISVSDVGSPARLSLRCGCHSQFWTRLDH